MHHYDPVYISTTDNKIKFANERQKNDEDYARIESRQSPIVADADYAVIF